jgi:predicted GNAT superfamily acetyltransferase
MLKQAFPQLPVGFYNILHDMIRDDGFSDSRLVDAVKHVIKTCVYPTPTIAQIVNFDRRIKLHTYGEVCAMISKGYRMVDFEKRKYRGGMFWVLKSEINI